MTPQTFVRRVALAAVAGAALAALPAAAQRAISPNYVFPDGSPGFALMSYGDGSVHPGIKVGFNPQPEPPGFGDTVLLLDDPRHPQLIAPIDTAYSLVFSLTGFGDGIIHPPPTPDSDGDTGFQQLFREANVTVRFQVSGLVDPGSWVSFNPQPDPPGYWFAVNFTPQTTRTVVANSILGDPKPASDGGSFFDIFFELSLDDGLTWEPFVEEPTGGVPEPDSWVLMIAGFGLVGGALRLERRRAAA
jgi:hypothetical protein